MSRLILSFSLILAALSLAHAQMWNGTDTLYGNEWINYEQQYFKAMVAEDGVYRIPYETLQDSGLPVNAINGSQYQLWRLGEEQPLYVSAAGPLAPGDFIEFYGEKNRSELDRHLFRNPGDEMLNPWYSLFTDTAAYFLTWVEPGAPTLRYEEVENELVNLPEREAWVWGQEETYFTDQVAKKHVWISPVNIYRSRYEEEGFAGSYQVSHNFSVACPGVFPSGSPAELELRFISNDNTAGHSLEVRVDEELLATEEYSGATLKSYRFERPAGSLGEAVNIKVNGLNNNDKYAVGGARLRYPRTPVFEGGGFYTFSLPASNNSRYLELGGLSAGGPAALFDLTHRQRLAPQPEGGLWKAKLPAAPGERQLAVATSFMAVSHLAPVGFADYKNADATFIIITNERLFDDGQGNNWVEEYADYRRSAAGGGHAVVVAEVQQLYDQFAYGLNRHPLSIRNFVHYAVKRWPVPGYCFLIGKGQEYPAMRKAASLEPAVAEGRMLVPSFGNPASDNLLVSNNNTSVPIIPVGRLAATSPAQVKIYLDKVKAVEANRDNPQTIADRAWMKQVVHLGGGGSAGEQASIRSFLETMGRELENNTFGAQVRGFYKTSTDPIQTSLSEQIFNAINEGSSLITFMGHSSPGTFDFNIDNPDNYNNYGKYPLMLSLGCYSGNAYTSGQSIGERFIFYENRAAVAFGASRGVGYLSSLGAFARSFYSYLGGSYYGQGIGDVLKATMADYDQNPFIGTATLVEQFTLQGDPAIRLHPAPGPDFVVDPASVQFDPRVATAQQDSLRLSFDALNLGRNGRDTFTVEIRQRFPGGNTVEAIRDTVAAPAFRTTYTYRIPIAGKEAVGLNTFFIRLDADNGVAELPAPAAELNNELVRAGGEPGVPYFIVDNTARPVYPPDFALVGETPVTLKASTTDALAPERTYLLEIDTTALFDSPLKQRAAITQRGGVIKWTPTLPWQDSTAYFWRISPDSTDAQVGYTWEGSSFTYIEGSPEGWGQGGYWQLIQDSLVNMHLSEDDQILKFTNNFLDIRLENKVFNSADPPTYVNNGQPIGSPWTWSIYEGLNIVVLEYPTLEYWRNPFGGLHGSVNTASGWESVLPFAYPTKDIEDRVNLINFLENVVPDSAYVIIYSAQRNLNSSYYPGQWAVDSLSLNGKNIFNVLESQGATQIRLTEQLGSLPYIFFYQKNIGPIEEALATSIDGRVKIEHAFKGLWFEGSLFTVPVGPAIKWRQLDFLLESSSMNLEDSIRVSVFGLKEQGAWDNLYFSNIAGSTFNLDLSFIDAEQYPYLRLGFQAYDKTRRTVPQIHLMQFIYDGIPEIAVNPNLHFVKTDSVQRGEAFRLEYAIENIGKHTFPGTFTKYFYNDDNGLGEELTSAIFDSISVGEFIIDTLSISTVNLNGLTSLFVRINPDAKPQELSFINNDLSTSFFVSGDLENPILDVTFDGENIMNGDIISPKPLIEVQLRDENRFLLIQDSSLIELSLIKPEASVPIVIGSEDYRWYPATNNNNNIARIEYQPEFTIDGEYELIVKARDVEGNKAGLFDYQIKFEVITKQTISNVINYPNPFSTATRFVYTLTGEVPVNYKIQIMTVSGRVVKEISEAELGPLRIGTHTTEYLWDGTDDYGNRLANGVYLYRFIAKGQDGNDLEIRDNGTAVYFKGGFGKMVILR